jgi:hypothetical protein
MAASSDHDFHRVFGIISTSVVPGLAYYLGGALILCALLPTYRFVKRDYEEFLSLGPGGTPSNFAGYLKVSFLRLFTLKDPFVPEPPTSNVRPRHGYLVGLPFRTGPRPAVAGIAPQRQTDHTTSPELHQAFKTALHAFADAYPSEIRKGNSCFEKHGLALFLSEPPDRACQTKDAQQTADSTKHSQDAIQQPGQLNPTCGDSAEICHLHATVSTVVLAPSTPPAQSV